MEANDYRKAREVLTRVHEFLSNLCRDARCDAHCSECIGASDLADDVYDVLHAPPRNCNVGTAEEQEKRFMKYCIVQNCGTCPCFVKLTNGDWRCNPFAWAQMPYEADKKGGSR